MRHDLNRMHLLTAVAGITLLFSGMAHARRRCS